MDPADNCLAIKADGSEAFSSDCSDSFRFICEPACTPLPPNCPSSSAGNLEFFGRKFYHSGPALLSYEVGVEYCLSNGMRMAAVDSQEDAEAVRAFMLANSKCE